MRKIIGYLVAGLLALTPLSASAAILWAGGEDTSLAAVGTASVNGTPIQSSFARVSLDAINTTAADPPANRWTGPTFTANGSIWVHLEFEAGSTTTVSNIQSLIVHSSSDASAVELRQNGTAGVLKLSSRSSGGSFTDLATASAYTAATPTSLDLAINCSAGTVTMYYNGSSVLTYSGSPCESSGTTLNQIEIGSFNSSGSGGSCAANWSCFEQVIVASEDTRSFHLATLTLQGAGATQAWTPNTLANVNKTAINDASFVSTSSNNQISEWTAPTSAPTGIWGVKTLIMNARLSISTTGPQNAEFIAHVSGSDYTSLCPNPTLTTGFANYYCQTDLSPATGLVWGINEIFNTGGNQLGYGVESLM